MSDIEDAPAARELDTERERERELEALRELGAVPHRNAHDPAPKALAAFDKAFGREPARATVLVQAPAGGGPLTAGSVVAKTVVPTLLAGLVGLYLLWAFSAAFALQGH